jgi:carboxyl-terminal processing protease
VSTTEVSLPDAMRGMRGKPGSKVTLTVMRDGWTETRDIEITREPVRLLAVQSQDLTDGITQIKVRAFQAQTARDVLARLEKGGMKGVILDLRGNAGGILTAAVEVSEIFLEEGRLVAYTESRVKKHDQRFTTTAKRVYRSIPMVVVVNHGTAAGAEIVAGALQDWGRAQLMGTRTFGRASIQTIIPLSDGTALRLTTSEWFTPKGRSVRGKGLAPDLTVDATSGETPARDAQLTAAVAHLKSLIARQGR